jgi:hypothetical protein
VISASELVPSTLYTTTAQTWNSKHHTIMDDGLIKDGATNTAAHRLKWWWKQLPLPTKLLAGASLAAMLLGSCTLAAHTMRSHQRECRDYARYSEMGPAIENKDTFSLSMAWHNWGYYYSYKQTSNGVTEGPRILLLVDIWKSQSPGFWISYGWTREYGMFFTIYELHSDTVAYSFELSIGQIANGEVVWSSSEEDDDNVVIDPSVVHLSFSNGATYNVYNDTVFLISYAFTGNELHVEQRAIDLKGVSNKCGMRHLFRRNADLDAQWRTRNKL